MSVGTTVSAIMFIEGVYHLTGINALLVLNS